MKLYHSFGEIEEVLIFLIVFFFFPQASSMAIWQKGFSSNKQDSVLVVVFVQPIISELGGCHLLETNVNAYFTSFCND